jgi:hypothetical protein
VSGRTPGPRSLIPILIWGLLLVSCGASEEAQVKATLEARRIGLEKKDIGLYLSSISPRYGVKEGERDRLREEALGMMQAFDSIEMRIEDCRILIKEDRAEALQAYVIRVRKGGQAKEVKGQERIGLAKEARGWKIISGL